MKYLIIALAVVLCACGKGESPKPSYSDTQIWDSVGIQYGRVYIVRIYDNISQSPLDTVLFNSDGTITEKKPISATVHTSTSITYNYTWNGRYYAPTAISSSGFKVNMHPFSDTPTGYTLHDYLIKDTISISAYHLFLVFPDGKHSGELMPK